MEMTKIAGFSFGGLRRYQTAGTRYLHKQRQRELSRSVFNKTPVPPVLPFVTRMGTCFRAWLPLNLPNQEAQSANNLTKDFIISLHLI